jgi:hypothetical protein
MILYSYSVFGCNLINSTSNQQHLIKLISVQILDFPKYFYASCFEQNRRRACPHQLLREMINLHRFELLQVEMENVIIMRIIYFL